MAAGVGVASAGMRRAGLRLAEMLLVEILEGEAASHHCQGAVAQPEKAAVELAVETKVAGTAAAARVVVWGAL